MTAPRSLGTVLLALTLLAGCASREGATPEPPLAEPLPLVEPRNPRTTAAEIYLGNLDSRIVATEKVLASRRDPMLLATLASDLQERARVLGRLEDLERALTLAREAAAAAPDRASVRLVEAEILAAFHRFDEARAVLSALPPSAAREARREALNSAQGRYDALPPAPATIEETSDMPLAERVALADRLFDLGRRQEAHALLATAEQELRTVNPHAVSWLQTRQGILYLREERLAAAGRYFAAAHERLPAYYLAAEHLAEVRLAQGRKAEALALYRAVSAQTGDPVFLAQLAVAAERTGNDAEAAAARDAAREALGERLARHPAAFADHGVDLLLADGQFDEALALAERNLESRRTVGAWLLLAEAARAAGHDARACEAWRHAVTTGLRPPEIEAARSGFSACETAASRNQGASGSRSNPVEKSRAGKQVAVAGRPASTTTAHAPGSLLRTALAGNLRLG